jgi:putative effector of murein hydrolase LrgA (UPF0299 family)
MIAAVAALLVCQLLGEVLVRALALPLPGPVAGMGLMFAILAWRGRGKPDAERIPVEIGRVADTLLRNLSLLFIPAAVGIVRYFGLLRQYGWIIVISVALSTAAALVVTVAVFRLAARARTHSRRAHDPIEER